jgi:hypothetical protein
VDLSYVHTTHTVCCLREQGNSQFAGLLATGTAVPVRYSMDRDDRTRSRLVLGTQSAHRAADDRRAHAHRLTSLSYGSSAVTSAKREADVAAAAGGAVSGGRRGSSSRSFPHRFRAARWQWYTHGWFGSLQPAGAARLSTSNVWLLPAAVLTEPGIYIYRVKIEPLNTSPSIFRTSSIID